MENYLSKVPNDREQAKLARKRPLAYMTNLEIAYQKSQEMQGRKPEKTCFLETHRNLYFFFQNFLNAISQPRHDKRDFHYELKVGNNICSIDSPSVEPDKETVLVGMVKIMDLAGNILEEFVIKSQNELERFVEEYEQNEIKQKYLPKILGDFRDNQGKSWAIYEKLEGWHNEDLVNNVFTDRVLLEKQTSCVENFLFIFSKWFEQSDVDFL